VCEVVPVRERDDLTFDHLRATSEAFLTSSTRDIQAIDSVDGGPSLPTAGPLTSAAMAAFATLVAEGLDP
jgi:branched-chain amino acid aminotransferase